MTARDTGLCTWNGHRSYNRYMPVYKRLILRLIPLSLIAGLQLIYLPLNRTLSGGIAPALLVDGRISVQPDWVFIYLAALPLWILALIWSTIKMDDRMYRVSVITAFFAILVGVMTYWLYPTYVIRPDITSQGLGSDWLRWVYANDRPYNALPSSHVYLTVLIGLLWSQWKPKWRWLLLGLVLVICLSTLFTKQHYLLDVVCGAFLAGLAYNIGIGIDRWWENQKSGRKK